MEEQVKNEVPQEVREGKLFAVLAYFGILCLFPLLLKKDNKFAYFHGRQGLVLFLGAVAAFLMNVIPILGQMIWSLATLVFGVLSIIGIIKVLMGQYWKIPVIGDIAEKINL